MVAAMAPVDPDTHAERAYRWTIRTLYLIAVVANLWLLIQTMKETPEGQIMLQRLEHTWQRLRASARARAYEEAEAKRVILEAMMIVDKGEQDGN